MLAKLLPLVSLLILEPGTSGYGNFGALALLFCNETDSSPDLRLEFDSGLLKYRDKTNANLFILNQTASLRSGLSFNVTCASRRAVDWKFDGLTANSAVKIDRYRNHDTTCHRMSLNFTAIDDQLTGTYTCYEISRPWKSLNFTLFTGRLRDGHFFRLHGQTIDIRSDPGGDLNAEVISFPCGLVHPYAQVRLLAQTVPGGGEWNTVAISSNRSSEFEFNPIHGFKVNVNRLHNGEYKCIVFSNAEDGLSQSIHNSSDVVSFNYRRLEGPTFIPQADNLILPRNLTSYQIQCIAPYPVHLTANGSLAFDISNDPSESSTRFTVIAKYKPGSLMHLSASAPGIESQNDSTLYVPSTRVSCMRNGTGRTKLLKTWNVRISSDEFLPGIYFDKTAGTAACYSSTIEVLEVSQVFCETDTECKLREPCITEEKEDWKCPAPPGNPKGPNIVLRSETSVTVDLQYRSGVFRCKSSDMDAMIAIHNSVNGELRLDADRDNAFGLEILGNRTVETFGNVTAQCSASKRLFYSKVNLELWNKGSLATYVLPDMILKDEFSEQPGLFVRKVTFQVPRGEFDELTCFVETYSPRAGYVIRRPLVVYQHTSPPHILGPRFVPVSVKKGAYNNLTCKGHNWSNISWEIPPTIKLSDLTFTKDSLVSELIIPVLDSTYEGLYTCLVENNFGVARKAFMVQVPDVEGSIPWLAIAIAAGVITAVGIITFFWWIVRKVAAVTGAVPNMASSREQTHFPEYPLELTIKPPPEAEPQHGVETRDEKLLQNILQQFREGIWSLPTTATSEENDTVLGQTENSLSSISPSVTYTHTETGNHVAMSASYNFEEHEIPRDNVQLYSNRILGSGEFGIVHGGKLQGGKYTQPIPVAIKTLQADADGNCVSAFLKELQVMIYVGKHPNIVELLGACTQAKSIDHIYIILKLCPSGSLEKYLRTRRKMFVNQITEDRVIDRTISPPKAKENSILRANFISTQDLLRWTIQIAAGMQFLVEKKVIHGDLACRNVLLDENLVVKISDFGLARRLYDYTKYVKKQQALLPWRWMAIESLQDLYFSPASDVWAFGVTAWEIFSLSEIPYPGIVWSMQFVEQLRAGHRNVRPRYATEDVYAIFKDCWLQDPADRPAMAQVLDQLSGIFTRDFISSNASSEYIDL